MKPTTLCVKCNKHITNNNFKKHENSCRGPKIKKIRGVDFDPNSGYKTGVRVSWNKGLTKDTDERVLKNGQRISETWTPRGAILLSSDELSTKAKKQGFGGYRPNAGRSKKFKVFDSFGNQTTLQSTFELAVFEILCELGVEWVRPKALKYDNRNYFADFYLPTYNVWLDPKNDYKAKHDAEKIQKVIDQNGVDVYVLRQHQISKEHISRLIYG